MAKYKSPKDLMTEYSISRSTVSNIIKEMLKSSRYPPNTFIKGSITRVNADAFQDYMNHRELLKHPNMRRYVPAYQKGEQ